ncbi:unnamed protein product, partial [Allacma fusca]
MIAKVRRRDREQQLAQLPHDSALRNRLGSGGPCIIRSNQPTLSPTTQPQIPETEDFLDTILGSQVNTSDNITIDNNATNNIFISTVTEPLALSDETNISICQHPIRTPLHRNGTLSDVDSIPLDLTDENNMVANNQTQRPSPSAVRTTEWHNHSPTGTINMTPQCEYPHDVSDYTSNDSTSHPSPLTVMSNGYSIITNDDESVDTTINEDLLEEPDLRAPFEPA